MKQRIRVVQLIRGFALDEHFGGAERFGIELAHRLDPALFEVAVFALHRYGTPSEQRWQRKLEDVGVRVANLAPARPTPWMSLFGAFLRLNTLVREFQPTIINTHFERGDVLALPYHSRAKLIRTVHTDEVWQNSPGIGALFNQVVYPTLFAAEVGVSRAVVDVLDARVLARVRQRHAHVIYNAIDYEGLRARLKDRETSRRILQLPTHGRIIGTVGRLVEQKGQQFLIEALRRVVEMYPDVVCVFIGTGELRERLKVQAASLGLSAHVRFVGAVPDAAALLPAFDLLVLPSLWEGFPTVLLEAMTAGVPLVATDVAGSRELVQPERTGVLVQPGDSTALAQGILELWAAPDRLIPYVEQARIEVTRFTLDRVAEQYGELYAQTAATTVGNTPL